ncbi:MAG: SxtJ family membrane protein [Pseudomonadota bacterium]
MKKEISVRDLRVFGLIWAGIFLIISFKSDKFQPAAIFISASFLLTSLIYPKIYRQTKIYENWIKIGDFLGKINGFLISFILFYGIFTPTAVILRLLKKDLLHKKLNSSKNTYFIDRKIQPGEMKNQF